MKNYYLGIIAFFSIHVICIAQTVNTGQVFINEETVFSTVSEFTNTTSGSFINHGDVYVYNHWENNGIVDFYDNLGLTRFIGDNTQLISGTEFSFFYNALFDNVSNQPAYQLSGNISIANEALFNQGIIDNDNFGGGFIFERLANHFSTSDNSHVDGPVHKIGDTSFEYPIGDAGFFRPAAISPPSQSTELYTAKYFFENTDTNYPINNLEETLAIIDNVEFWDIEQTSGNSDILLSLSWREGVTPNEILIAPFEDIHIARWDAFRQLWIDEGGVVDINAQKVTTAIQDFGIFTLARVKSDVLSMDCELIIQNLITPNGDGIDDFFNVNSDNSICVQRVDVKIYNRWGVKVFDVDNYGENRNVFRGFSEGRITLDRGQKLPTGTYFYTLQYTFQNETGVESQGEKAGYLYINGE